MSTPSTASEPFKEVQTAVEYIRAFQGTADEFKLPVADKLNDPFGVNMAIITDVILEKGFEPDGFNQQRGYRVYVYTTN